MYSNATGWDVSYSMLDASIESFWFTDKINHRRYKHSSTIGNSYTLSERYQLAENIRTSELMRKCILVSVCIFPFGIGSFIVMFGNDQICVKMLSRLSWEFLSVVYAFAMTASIMKSNVIWRTNFLQLLYCKCRFRVAPDDQIELESRNGFENMYIFKTSKGEQMVFDVSKETDIYFKQLHRFWDVPSKVQPPSTASSTRSKF
uniref:Transmembrane protein 186 n=1 Tax=Panagrellus redivivus TaxID=6233 RepID=A0A7E4WDJ5_PANRE